MSIQGAGGMELLAIVGFCAIIWIYQKLRPAPSKAFGANQSALDQSKITEIEKQRELTSKSSRQSNERLVASRFDSVFAIMAPKQRDAMLNDAILKWNCTIEEAKIRLIDERNNDEERFH